jgi:hypothetical protein
VPVILLAHYTHQTTARGATMIALKVKDSMTDTQTELKESTVEYINELIDDSYAEDDIYEFIAEYGEQNFVDYYTDYVENGESYSYQAVDVFIEEFGVYCIGSFQDSYRGQWDSKGDYAENFVTDCYSIDFPAFIEIDWENTFDNLDLIFCKGFVFSKDY